MNEDDDVISALWRSFYSAALYRDVQRWRGKALLYLAMVLLLCWTPVTIRMQLRLAGILQRAEEKVVPQMPQIQFAQGKISTPENRPYLYHFGEGAQKLGIIIDTSGRYTSLEGQDAQFLLTRNRCFIRQKTGEVREYDLSKSRTKPMVINGQVLHKIFQLVRKWALLCLFVFIFVFSFLKRLIQAFLIALIGLALAMALETDLDLGELLSLAIVSMTPAMLLETAATLTGIQFRWMWLLWGLLILGYFVFAINAASTGSLTEEQTPVNLKLQ